MTGISYKKERNPFTGKEQVTYIKFPMFKDKHSYDSHRHLSQISSHRGEKRYRKEKTKILRKRRIIKETWALNENDFQHLPCIQQFHRLSKSKIHCSCPMCTSKVRTQGWKHSDLQKMAKGWDCEDISETKFEDSFKDTSNSLVYQTQTETMDEEGDIRMMELYALQDSADIELVKTCK